MSIGLAVDQKAPAFSVRDQFGRVQTLDTLKGTNGTVLLFFSFGGLADRTVDRGGQATDGCKSKRHIGDLKIKWLPIALSRLNHPN